MQYLSNTAQNYIYHAHSYFPIRETFIYKKLNNLATLEIKKKYRLIENFKQLEKLIDKAEIACVHLKKNNEYKPLKNKSN